MRGFRKLGEPLFSRGLTSRLRLGTRMTAGGDTTAPTVTITSTESSPSFANPIPITFTLSEISTDFALADVTVGAGGSLGNFAGSGTSYTADLTITTAGATVTLDIAAGAFHDAAGNENIAATQFSITTGLWLRDEFTTDDAAPLTSPRTCEPGPGTLTFTDTANRGSIASGKLVVAGGAAAFTAVSGAIARANGRAVVARMSIGDNDGSYIGVSNTGASRDRLELFQTLTRINIGGTVLLTVDSGQTLNTLYKFAIVPRATGHIYLKERTGNDFTVLWLTNVLTDALNAQILPNNSNDCQYEYLKVIDLSQFAGTQFAWATNYTANPGNNAESTSEANAFIEFTLVAQAGVTQSIWFRRTTDDETWRIDCDQAGGTIKLYSRTGGVDTEVDAGKTQTWVAGNSYRVVIKTDGNSIKTYVADVAKHTATSAFNNTATGVKVSHVGSNLACFPLVVALPSHV